MVDTASDIVPSRAPEIIFEAPEWKIRRLAELRAQLAARTPTVVYPTPGKLARALDPMTVQTPALDLIDAALVDVAEGRCDRLILSMPPQEGKSERASHYGSLWLMHRNPNLRIALISHDQENASRVSYAIRNDLMTFTGDEGNLDLTLRLRRDSKAASRWYIDGKRGGMYAIGIGGSLTGRPVDVLIIDDPVKDYRAADSILMSEMAWQWWQSVARPRLAPAAPVIVILTRWHENDLAGRLLAKQREDEQAGLEHYDKWRVINIPAQADHDPTRGETDPLGRAPGEFMLSARGRTREQWEATKAATSSRIWSAMYQGRPSPETGDVWLRPWWRRYESALWSTVGLGYCLEDPDQVIQSWDMTFKDTSSSDYVVGQVWARYGANAYLVDQVRRRMTFTETLSAFKALCARWPQATAKLVEDKANGTAVIDTLKREIAGIVPINPHESKYARANAVAPFIEAGNVWLPSSAVALFEVDPFIEECVAFPNGAHDDQVDGTSQALTRLLAGNYGPVEVASAARFNGRMRLPAAVGSPR